MKKLFFSLLACSLLFNVTTQAQYFGIGKKKEKAKVEEKPAEQPSLLNEWQKSNNHKIVFFDDFLGSTVTESASSSEIELGEDFWFRAYFDKAEGIDRTKPLDIRLSCQGVSLSMKDIWAYSRANFSNTNGILPAYDQLHLAGMDNWWKNNNIFSMNGFIGAEDFDKPGSSGQPCQYVSFPNESILRMLLAKIDGKVVYGTTLEVKYELIERQSGNYFDEAGGEWLTRAEGTLKLKVGDKAKNISGNLYRLPSASATYFMEDPKIEKAIKEGMLGIPTSAKTVAEVYKVDLTMGDFKVFKDANGVPINRWISARVLFKSKNTNMYFTGIVNATFEYNGTDYNTSVKDLYYQCGVTPVPSFGIPK